MSVRTHELDVHPALDVPLLRDLIHPGRPLWTPRELRDLTRTVTAELTGELLSVVQFHADQRWWARLALTPGVELWLLSWMPGQGTEPHDHGGASGSFSVLLGTLGEDYRYPGGPVRSGRHQVGAAIGFGPNRAHQVRNTGRVNAASVHAYSPPLLPVREYESLLDVSPVPAPRSAPDNGVAARNELAG
ncbi:cysteine dioxygenase [Streptoalloteichus hindustanus]|uniref:Cysteine dioxygenase type I n=1 Tax=Streptoalloteichus hindustanus TaxID=2017 RepID=A0A1M5GKE4_STRHI|nr:cysteine dioxygenase family protein [Streptoalloteichus hindustanus]SHG04179.1 Cysteine dioxygenase type I [Streptoalloteichus hindustanus]